MKKFTTTFFLLMAMVLLLPTEVGAWSDVYLFSTIDGVWSSNDKTDNDKFTKTDANTFYKDIDATNITGDISFCLYVTDNNGFEIFPSINDDVITAEYEAHDSWSGGAYQESRNSRAWKIMHSSDGRDKYRILFRYDNITRKFYVNVIYLYDPVLENKDEISCFVEVPSTINEVKIWAWNGSTNYTGSDYDNRPSLELKGYTTDGNKIFKWTYSGTETKAPSNVIFTKGATGNDKFADGIAFTNHGYYVYDGTNNKCSYSHPITNVSGGETTTTATLTYGRESVEGKEVNGVYTFANIPYTAFDGTRVSFQLKTVTNGVTTYYNMPSDITSINAVTEYTAETSTTGRDWIYKRATVPNRGNFKVTLNTTNNKVALTDNTFVGTEPETGDDYYIFGDWNNWKAKDAKRFKMQPVYGQKGVYSMYINTPVNLNGSGSDKYALKFCVSSGKNIDENINADNINTDFWSHVFRPKEGDKTIEGNNITSGEAAEQSGDACWILKKNVRTLGSGYANGGCYLFTIDTNTGDWTIKSLENVRVIYFLRGENDYVFNGEYLVDGTEKKKSDGTDYERNPNNNYTGLLKMEKGSHYLLSDGYHTFGSTADDISYNSQSSLSNWKGNVNQPYQIIKESATLSGNQNMPFNMESKKYYAEANVVVMNQNDETGFSASDKRILWYDGTGHGGDNEKTLQVWFKHGEGEYDLMTYDEELHTWVTKGVALDDNEKYQFKESRYDGNGNIVVETPELSNTHEGTFKAVYVDQYTAGTEKPIYDVLLSVDLTYPNKDVFIRTFSDYESRFIPDGLTAYYATGYNKETKTVNLKSIEDGIIPAYTGVIIVYDGSSTGINFDRVIKDAVQTAETVSMQKSKAPGTAPRLDGTTPFGYGEADGGIDKNWLVTDLKHDKASAGPVTRNESNVITYRNYYLANMDLDGNGSKTLGFYRVKAEGALNNQKNVRKAYLAMPASVQTDGSNDELQDNTSATPVTAAKRVTMIFDGEIIGGTPTGIDEVNVNTGVVSKDNSFYNLQGMKVSKPSKGIYIYRGRKVIIK